MAESSDRHTSSRLVRRVAFASFIGTTIEWYDFFIYGTAAALVFDQLFFPEFDPLVGTLAAFATFAVGFIARPLGGVVFAHFGDRVGRKPMLVWSLLIMGVATLCIGLLPTYAAIGVWSPVLLVVLRFAQGFGVGGEWGGAALMSVEHAPAHRRGFFGSWPQVGVPAGLLIGTAIFALISNAVPDEQFRAWGWRIPFLLSVLLIVVGLIIRLKISESPVFARVMDGKKAARMPVLEAVRTYPKTIALATGSFIGTHATFYVATVWLVAYATNQVGYDRTTVLNANTFLSAVGIALIVAFGALSDRVGRRPLYLAGMSVLALFAFPYFQLVETGSVALYIVAGIIVDCCRSAVYGPQSAFFSELFGTRTRYSGASVSYQFAAILGGGFAPMICTALVAWTGSSLGVVVYVIAVSLISLVCSYLLTETFRRDLSEEPAPAPPAARTA